jgi:hypothetical protein
MEFAWFIKATYFGLGFLIGFIFAVAIVEYADRTKL